MARPLEEKLGFRPGMRVLVEGRPPALILALPEDDPPPHDLLLFFAADCATLAVLAPRLDPLYRDGARLWIAYPKRSGAIRTDIHRDQGWAPIEALGLLGVAQVALDATWSALRFRRRHEIPRITRAET